MRTARDDIIGTIMSKFYSQWLPLSPYVPMYSIESRGPHFLSIEMEEGGLFIWFIARRHTVNICLWRLRELLFLKKQATSGGLRLSHCVDPYRQQGKNLWQTHFNRHVHVELRETILIIF